MTDIFEEKGIWMYWPGENAWMFKQNVEEGFMCCGLPADDNGYEREVGDLNELMNTRGALDIALREAYHGGRTADGRILLENFANKMDIGDFIIARSNFDAIVGIGIVTGDYYFDENRSVFRHCRKVEWIKTGRWSFLNEFKKGTRWNRVTLVDRHYREYAKELIKTLCESEDY